MMEVTAFNESTLLSILENSTECQLEVLQKSSSSDITLDYLNDEETKRRIVPIVYLALLMVFGVPGNILIIYVYTVKFQRKATHRTFVVALAITDFLVCTFTISFEIAQMTHEYTFYAEWLCKFGRTLNAILTTSSALILVALSANRYRHICQPMRIQLTYSQALKCIGCIICFTLFLAWPEVILTGLTTHDREHNLTAFDCSHAQNYINTNYPVIYSVGMLIFYILCMVSLLIMCFFIGRQIIKHMEFRDQFRLSKMFSASQKSTSSFTSTTMESGDETNTKINNKKAYNQKKNSKSPSVKRKTNSPMKVTRTALIVSICFNIVFLPYVVVKLIAAITEDNIMAPSAVTSILLPILSRTHFINNIVNFMIYISMDMAFRRHCKAIFTEIVYKVLNALKYINCTLCIV